MAVNKQKILRAMRNLLYRTLKSVSNELKPRIISFSKRVTKHTYHLSKKTGKKAGSYGWSASKYAHHHVAKRPHQHLRQRWSWYDRWHHHPYHNHVHGSLAGLVLLLALAMVMVSYGNVKALSDLNDSWDFATPSDYSFGSGVEASGSVAQLKAQNYTSDSNTAALYHLDESSGSTAADSSSHGNDATVSNASFTTGNLNNGLDFNGTDSSASASDSSSLSLTQQNTLEGWTKFNSSFSAGSTDQRQSVIDKGAYQLYYDNETGKVTYELTDSTSTDWSLTGGNNTNGSWDTNGKRSVNATVKIGGDIYAGIGSDIGDGEVWRWDGSDWTLIGGGADSVHNSWDVNTYEGVYSLATDGSNLYAGLGLSSGEGEVWKWDGSSWSKIGGDSTNSGWTNYAEQIWALDYFDGKLYAGIGSSANDAEVWEWGGSSWSKIGGDSLNSGWTTGYEYVASLTDDGSNLYVGLGASAGDGEVWKWDGSSWAKIGGDNVNSGWDSTIETVRTLRYYGTKLYAGLGDTAGDADVWEWNGSSWSKIGGDGANSSWSASTYEQIGSFAYDGVNLYAGLGTGNGDGEVWKWSGSSWSQIGGDGQDSSWVTNQGDTVNTLIYDSGKLYAGTYDSGGSGWFYSWDGSSWSEIGGNYVNNSWGYYGVSAVQVMQNIGGYLYAGLGNTAGSAMVWRFDGSSWSIIGGQGVNSSWAPDTYEQVLSMASYNGHLVVGLGTSANDAEVWEWDGSSWTKIGGDSLNSGWTTNYEEVDSLASYGGYLYAGLGASANEGEVWRWDGSEWTKIGDSGLNGGWANNHERVLSLAINNGKLVAGLGSSTNDSEVWEWDGSAWTQLGGDGVNSSWNGIYEQVESLIPYNGKLYAGLGAGAGDASLWEWDGSAWTEVGGDDINSSWTTGTYEKVKTLAVYNGNLYVGLGNTAGDGEVWRWDGSSWTKIGGNSLNGGWTNTVEEVESFSAYKGILYAGNGLSANADGLVWSWGNNAYLQSSQSSFDNGWHHVAGTYDGTIMKIYIDGALDASKSTGITMPDNSLPLKIGSGFGGREYGKAASGFQGKLDEVRISNTARSNLTSLPYTTDAQTITLNEAVRKSGVWHWDGFAADETANGGSINYRLSDDDGATWKYWNGSGWVTSANTGEANSATDVDANISSFPVTFYGIKWQAVLHSDGNQQVKLNGVSIQSTSDYTTPSVAGSTITASKSNGGASLAQNEWTNGGSPNFDWNDGTDSEVGVKGYCAYLGTDNTANPTATKGMLGTSPVYTANHCPFIVGDSEADLALSGYLATALATSTSPYYLTVKAIDKAGNISSDQSQFYFRFDNTAPDNPTFISAPSGFVNSKDVTLTWATSGGSAPSDGASGLAGLQYRIASDGTWYGDSHSGTGDSSDLLSNDGSYTMSDPPDYDNLNEGINTIYFRTWDQAGNVTGSYVTAALKINTNGAPSEPQNLAASPASNTANSFSFSWGAPASFVGDVNNLTYCYTINALPNSSNCTFTNAGSTSLGSSSYATQPGSNTLYLVAKDESSNINYDSYTSTIFTANTAAPGIPLNTDIVDVSIKTTSNWRLALTWDAPSDTGSGVASYRVLRSTDGSNYSQVGSSSSTTYIDAGLSQQRYYYKVKACDNTNNCGALSSSVNDLPTGKFTSPANLVAQPKVSNITTKRATVSWSTDRTSDSKIALGTASGKYSASEIADSKQVSSHEINLDNLAAGTTYYFRAKWTDEDGNTGTSQEFSFRTQPPPTLKEIHTVKVGLTDATIEFTSKNATKIGVYYGKSEAFGGLKTISTSTSESTYDVGLTGLDDGSKYFYKLVSYDSEGTAYDGSISSFTTPPRPAISNLSFQPVKGKPTSTQRVTWQTNVPSDSTLTYGKEGTSGTDVTDSKSVTSHEMIISDLADDSQYFLIAQSRDANGNVATSDRQSFHTALDTRPPTVSNITVESSIRGTGAEARGQVVVSWHTDEPSTSQVAYGEGSDVRVFNNRTAEDSALSFEHIVIVSDLPTSKVYSVQPVSRDKAGNAGTGTPQSAIIGRASDSVLTIVLNTLRKVFGF